MVPKDPKDELRAAALEAAQDMANHSDPRTTKLYDRPLVYLDSDRARLVVHNTLFSRGVRHCSARIEIKSISAPTDSEVRGLFVSHCSSSKLFFICPVPFFPLFRAISNESRKRQVAGSR